MPGVRKHGPQQEPVVQALAYRRKGMSIIEIAVLMKKTEAEVKSLLRKGKRLVAQSEEEDLTAFLARFDPQRLNQVLARIERRLDELEARFDILPPEYRRDEPPGLWEYMLSKISRRHLRDLPVEFVESWRRGETIPPPAMQRRIERAFAKALAEKDKGADTAEDTQEVEDGQE